MNDSNNTLNPWLIPVTLGASGVAGFVAGKLFGKRPISANRALKLIRHDFAREGTITGSWIDHRRVPFQRYAVKTSAYRGGLTRLEDNEPVNYEFRVDAYTGSLLELKRLADD
ncbi:PepSY domain-containing protein [Limosilactobacillus panis]|jgi:predicted small secreted protein|nr:PepSY domain-containing protein [Limosilactobacillus panis]QZN92520.1 PepSY domain-containing protein [Limosilactobacillus panis]